MATTAITVDTATNKAPSTGKKMGRPRKNTTAPREVVKFRLYVADQSPNSVLARGNLSALCAQHLPDQHEIEIVDVFCEPRRARDDGIIMTPTLVKVAPLPMRKIIGPLFHPEAVLAELGLKAVTA